MNMHNAVIGTVGVDDDTLDRIEHRFPHTQIEPLSELGTIPYRLRLVIIDADNSEIQLPELRERLRRARVNPPIVVFSTRPKTRDDWARKACITMLPGRLYTWVKEHRL